MANANETSPATRRFTPVHRQTGDRLDLLISARIDIPRGRKWQRVVRDLRTGKLYRTWNKGCGLGGCMCDAYAEEIL